MTTRIYTPTGKLLEEEPDTVPLHAGSRDSGGRPLDMADAPAVAAEADDESVVNDSGDKTDERSAAIVGAIVELTRRADREEWTEDGLPRVDAIERLTGLSVSAAERDSAFAIVNGED